MFKCTTCGPVADKEYRVITAIRKVQYLSQVRYDKSVFKEGTPTIESNLKVVKRTRGTEIVEEKVYCKKHVPKNVNPKVVGEVTRENLVGIKRAQRGEN